MQMKFSDVAKHFKVTRQTIYNIVKEMSKQGVKNEFISKIEGVNHVNEEGMKYIADRLGVKFKFINDAVSQKEENTAASNEKTKTDDEYLKRYIATLEDQLKIKDDQIKHLHQVIDDMHEINKQGNFIQAMNIKGIEDKNTADAVVTDTETVEISENKKSDGLFKKIKRLFVYDK